MDDLILNGNHLNDDVTALVSRYQPLSAKFCPQHLFYDPAMYDSDNTLSLLGISVTLVILS